MLACLLRFGDDGPFGLLDVNWLTPEKRRELTVIGEGGMLDRLLHHAGRVAHRVADLADRAGTSSRTSAATPRAPAMRFALRKVEPLRAELEAFADCVLDDTPEPDRRATTAAAR